MASNYPPDIHQYDDDCRSPFYVEPWSECQECKDFYEDTDMANSSLCHECDAEMRAYDSASLETA